MQFDFIQDSRWADLDEATKQRMIDLSFDEEVASDERWFSLDVNTQQAMKNAYFEKAKVCEEYITAPEERGLLSSAFSHLARGGVSAIKRVGETAELADLTPEQIDEETGILDIVGRKITGWADKTLKETPSLRPSKAELEGKPGFVRRGVMSGIESMPLSASVAAGAIGGALLAAPIPIPGARIVGGAIGGLGALIAQFGAGEYGDQYKSVYEELERTRPGITEDEKREISHRTAFGSAAFEVGTELPEHLFALYSFGGSKVLTTPIKATLKNMLRKPAKALLKGVGKQMPVAVGTEMIAGGGQAWVRQKEGLLSPTIEEGVKESIIPAITMSIFFGAGATGLNYAQSRSVMKQLNSPNIDTRINAIDQMAQRIAINTKDESLASMWQQGTLDVVARGERFDFNESIVDFASIKMAEDIEQEEAQVAEKEIAIKEISVAATVDEAVGAFEEAVKPTITPSELAIENQKRIGAIASEYLNPPKPQELPSGLVKTPEGKIVQKEFYEEMERMRQPVEDRKKLETEMPTPAKPAAEVARESVGVEKKPVEFIGMRERLNKLPVPLVNELDTKSTVAYDPAKHEMTNLPKYEKAVAGEKVEKPILDTLIQEAKKYKTAEEFETKLLFHGGSGKQDLTKTVEGTGLSTSKDINAAKQYIHKGGNIGVLKIKNDAKILDSTTYQSEKTFDLYEKIREYAKKKGYDAIDYTKDPRFVPEIGLNENEVLILNGSIVKELGIIKTKAQLTDIWNKAQAKPQLPKPPKAKPPLPPTEPIKAEAIPEVKPKVEKETKPTKETEKAEVSKVEPDFSKMPLADITVQVSAIREKTGEIVKVKENAETALNEANSELSTLQKILNCL